MTGNRLLQLSRLGQSIWYDYIRREKPAREGGHRQRPDRLPGLRGDLSRATLRQARGGGRARTAATVGVDLDEGSRLSRPVLRGGARRAGDGGYPDARDAGGLQARGKPHGPVYDNIPCASAVFDDLAQLEIDA